MNRRGFLGAMLAAAAAPAIVRAESLMKIVVPKKEIILVDDFFQGFGEGDFSAEMWSKPVGGEFTHLVAMRKDGKLLTYRDGVLVSAECVKKDWMPIRKRPGNCITLDNVNNFNGNIDDVKIIEGIAPPVRWPGLPPKDDGFIKIEVERPFVSNQTSFVFKSANL